MRLVEEELLMGLPHGVLRCEDGTYEFYWLGSRLSLEDFNKHTFQVAQEIFEEINGVAMGMDLSGEFDASKIVIAKLEAVEEVLKLPLCDACRKVIGG
jgi:hypothetical protein